MNYLQLVNSVLRRLRESEVTTVQGSGNANSYARLIGDYVNEAKSTVESAWQWLALKQTVPVTLVSGTSEYQLSPSYNGFQPEFVYNEAQKWELEEMPHTWIIEQQTFGTANNAPPTHFSYSGVDSATNNLKVTFYPTPNAAGSIKFYGTVRPSNLTADSDILLVPERPVILLATAMAQEERGEDSGQQSINSYRLAQSALADAISFDAGRQTENTTWYET